MPSASASANIKSASANISIRIKSSDHGIDIDVDIDSAEEMHDAEEKPDAQEKPKKNYVSGWLLFRRDRGPQAKKVLEKLHIVASGPNLVKVLSAMWAEIGERERATWNEKAKAIRYETEF